jgi:glycosyltransferase involved in cell wall biosynthesis
MKNQAKLSLTVAGDGPDLIRLKGKIAAHELGGSVRFCGAVSRDSVPSLMLTHDAFLFPSIYEGLPITLLEAMAAGCVPVASRIRGVTDFIIQNEENGLLFKIGDCSSAASHLSTLYCNPELLAKLSRSAIVRAHDFGLEPFAGQYARLIQRVYDSPRKIRAPLSMSDWRVPSRMGPGLRRFAPSFIKNQLRAARERLH